MRRKIQGQVTAEVAVLFAFVIGGFVAVGFYLQRGVQGSTKANADSVGSQYSTTSAYSSYSASDSHEPVGTTVRSTSCSETQHDLGSTSPADLGEDCGTKRLENAETVAVRDAPTDTVRWRP